ncbi:MAG: SOS response-associated peptidase [Flavobacterium sp.]|nr:SOS response-associated peptidase [Flavobacterium sp.]
MCYRVEVKAGIQEIANRFKAQFESIDSFNFDHEINGFAHEAHPVIIDKQPGIIASNYHWGLIPGWCKDNSIRKNTLNAKVETLDQKPSFRDVVNNRCLVIATGYYEWRWNDEKGKSKQKFVIHSAEDEIFTFAGIYSVWRSPENGETVNTFSIVTTGANQKMAYIHNTKKRMPIMLKSRDEQDWLNGTLKPEDVAFPNYNVELIAFTSD